MDFLGNSTVSLLVPVLKVIGASLPGAAAGALTGYYSGRLAERAKRGDKIREDHLVELKDQLLRVLAARFTRYYQPACEGQTGVIERTVIQINKPDPMIAENPYLRSEFSLQIIPIRSETPNIFGHTPGPQLHSDDFIRLLEDAKTNHYPELIKNIDAFDRDFALAAAKHLAHVELIKTELKKALNLPAQMASLSDHETWAEYEELALFIYRHHLDINPFHLQVYPQGSLEISASSTQAKFVRLSSQSAVASTLDRINTITAATKKNADCLTSFAPLKPQLQELKRQLEAVIHDKKLPSQCPFT